MLFALVFGHRLYRRKTQFQVLCFGYTLLTCSISMTATSHGRRKFHAKNEDFKTA